MPNSYLTRPAAVWLREKPDCRVSPHPVSKMRRLRKRISSETALPSKRNKALRGIPSILVAISPKTKTGSAVRNQPSPWGRSQREPVLRTRRPGIKRQAFHLADALFPPESCREDCFEARGSRQCDTEPHCFHRRQLIFDWSTRIQDLAIVEQINADGLRS